MSEAITHTADPVDPSGHILSIGQLAEATGVSIAALRAWEHRHGFPAPHRPGNHGHRRYSTHDIAVINEVVRLQRDGARLGQAIKQARAGATGGVVLSVFVEVVARYPGLPHTLLTRPACLALSRAIEDEILQRGLGGHLFGGFQSLRHFDAARSRWRRLADVVETAHAFARLNRTTYRDSDDLTLVDVPPDAPLAREWIVLYDGPPFAVALMALERAEGFDVAWTVDSEVVRRPALCGCRVVGRQRDGDRTSRRPVGRPPVRDPQQVHGGQAGPTVV